MSKYLASSTWRFPSREPESLPAGVSLPITPPNYHRSTNAGETSGNTSKPKSLSSRTRNLQVPLAPVIYDVTDDDEFMDEEELSAWVNQQNQNEMRKLSTSSSTSKLATRQKSSVILPRNLPITAPFASLDDFSYNEIRLSPKVYVEMKDGDFMKIVHIVRDTRTSEVTLRGFIFRRTREMNGVLDRKLNEVCWIIHIDDDDPRDPNIQGLETIPVTEVVKRRKIRLTNLSFPALSFRDDEHKDTEEIVENERVLVCRYKYLCFYPNAKARTLNAWCEKGFHRLRADDCDKRSDNNMKDEDLRTVWRGVTSLGGSQEGWLPGEKEFLRQEAVSIKGIISWQSLKIPGGIEFPPGDPMKRGSVGRLLREMTVAAEVTPNTAPNVPTNSDDSQDASLVIASDADDEVEEVASSHSTTTRAQQQRHHRHEPRIPLAALDKWLGQSECGSDGGSGVMHALNRSLRQSSMQAQRRRHLSLRIVEFDAQVKTSSRSGIYEKRCEGKITETYVPKPGAFHKKRKAEQSFGSPARPRKRTNVGLQEDLSSGTVSGTRGGSVARRLPRSNLYKLRDASPSDSDRTSRNSQSEDSVEEICTPTEARGYEAARLGLLTPLSLRRNGSVRTIDPCRSAYATPSRTARLSSILGQGRHMMDDEDDEVDLTRPRTNLKPAFSTSFLRSSMSRQPSPSTSIPSRPNFSSNSYKMSPSPRVSSRPMPSHESLSKSHYRESPSARLPISSISNGSLLRPHRNPPKHRGRSPWPSPAAAQSLRMRLQSITPQQITVKQEKQRPPKDIQRRYTFGDCFCGAGGMSRGAINAGLRINWGFDFNLSACQTYALNFFGTPIYNVWANDFSEAKGDHIVDICHLSPPCQFFSDAHTWAGKDDEMNTASLFAIFNLLEKAKPRVVTLEQTSGLVRRHPIFFNAVVNMFTSRGFSVRWRVMNCADFGLSQRRMRLFVIASWYVPTTLPYLQAIAHVACPEARLIKLPATSV